MTQLSVVVNKKGTILSLNVQDADVPTSQITTVKGKHFSRLTGFDCRKFLRKMMRQTIKTHEPAVFQTFFLFKGMPKDSIVEWKIIPQSKPESVLAKLFTPAKYVLVGKCA